MSKPTAKEQPEAAELAPAVGAKKLNLPNHEDPGTKLKMEMWRKRRYHNDEPIHTFCRIKGCGYVMAPAPNQRLHELPKDKIVMVCLWDPTHSQE